MTFELFLLLLLVCPVEGQGVAGEVDNVLTEVKLLVNISHRCGLRIHTFKGLGVILVKIGNEDQKLTKPPLLKHPHQIWIFKHRIQIKFGFSEVVS